MTTISRKPHQDPAALTFAMSESTSLSIPYTRTSEVCGPSRRTLALIMAGQMTGPILWIKPSWQGEDLNPQGITKFLNPGRITFISPKRTDDVLWCMEEVLRSGCTPTVIAECDTPPPLTPIRRLHLAAEHGAHMAKMKILPLILSPADGGSQGIETRWHMAPRHTSQRDEWLIERRRARMAPPAAWALEWHKSKARPLPATATQTIAAE